MKEDIVILPKGTIFNINGFCGELIEDTPALSPDIKKHGMDYVKNHISDIPACNQRFYKNPSKKGNVKNLSIEDTLNHLDQA